MRSNVERLFEMICDLVRVGDHGRVLGHRPNRIDDVVLLVSQLPKPEIRTRRDGRGELDLTREHEHGNRVEPPTENARDCVGPTRAGGNADACDASRHARIALGGDCAGLLVVIVRNL